MSDPQGIVYSSGVIIDDDSFVATLTVLYERVYLPWSTVWPSLNAASVADKQQHPPVDFITQGAIGLFLWEDKWRALYEHKVLERLSAPSPQRTLFPPRDLKDFAVDILKTGIADKESYAKVTNAVHIGKLSAHFHRNDIVLPQMFLKEKNVTRASAVSLEAFAAFRYFLPKLNALQPDEILELRRKVNHTREGFTMHLQKLSKGLDGMVRAGEKLADLSGYALGIVETDLIPDYKEFRRQLQSERAAGGEKVLDAAGKIAEIDSGPSTPKFWLGIARAMGFLATKTAAEQKEHLSNRYQAFEFMKEIDDFSQRRKTHS